MPALSDLDVTALSNALQRLDCTPSHARTLLRNYYENHGQLDFSQIKVGKRIEAVIGSIIPQRQSRIITRSQSGDGTLKLLIAMQAGGWRECWALPGEPGRLPVASSTAQCMAATSPPGSSKPAARRMPRSSALLRTNR